MKVDYRIDEKKQTTYLTYLISNIKTDSNYLQILALINIISADYCLDPEISIHNLKDICKDAFDSELDKVIFEITEDGIEVELA